MRVCPLCLHSLLGKALVPTSGFPGTSPREEPCTFVEEPAGSPGRSGHVGAELPCLSQLSALCLVLPAPVFRFLSCSGGFIFSLLLTKRIYERKLWFYFPSHFYRFLWFGPVGILLGKIETLQEIIFHCFRVDGGSVTKASYSQHCRRQGWPSQSPFLSPRHQPRSGKAPPWSVPLLERGFLLRTHSTSGLSF